MKTKVNCFYLGMMSLIISAAASSNLLAQGSWTSPFSTGVEAIHMTVLDTGRVFVFSYRESSNAPWGTFDPESPAGSSAQGNTSNYFCAGHTVLEDGRLLMVDGTANGGMGRFNPDNETWSSAGNTATNQVRWYPSTIILGNGKAFTLGGTSDGGGPGCSDGDLSGEIYDPASNSSALLNGGANLMSGQEANAYPRIFLLSEQNANPNIFKVFNAGPFAASEYYTINTDNNTATKSSGPTDGPSPNNGCAKGRIQAAYVQLDDLRIMGIGGFGFNESGSTSSVVVIDAEAPSPSWSSLPNLPQARHYITGNILADGRVIVIGGTNDAENNRLQPAIYNPTSNSWSQVASLPFKRNYHTSSILLPSGKICVSGGEDNGGQGTFGETDQMQVYSPDYLSAGSRPVISSAPTTAGYGANINVNYSSSNTVTDVVLRRPGSTTHSFSYNQIGVPCSFTDNGSSLTVSIPSNPNRLPPGYYMLFVLSNNSGTKVPSIAKWIQISGSAPPPDTTPPTPNPGTFSTVPSSTGETSITMTATAATDASPPVEYDFDETTGNPGGSDSPWQSSRTYNDTGLSAGTQYCYRTRSRDSVGNTGSWSSALCATTDVVVDTTPPSQPDISSVVANSDTQVTATSTVSTDAEGSNPVEYQFDETTGAAGSTDSGWQTSTTYVDSGLNASTQYCYRVRSRDSAGNTTNYSGAQCATTNPAPDNDPPTPNPLTWESIPSALNDSVVVMTASLATDPAGSVEYQFDETSGNTGATDSGWTANRVYYDYDLAASTQYVYRVRARDFLGNIGTYSSSQAVTTNANDGFLNVMVGPGTVFFPANITIPVGSSVQWEFVTDSDHNVWSGVTGGHTVFDGNPPWDGTPSGGTMLFSSTSDPVVTNPAGSSYSMTFDQAFLDASTGDLGVDAYNYHCHIHGTGLHAGTITITGGADNDPPTPNPMTFASAPAATSSTTIAMTATTATDQQLTAVEYFFDETIGNAGGSDSAWQSSTSYTDTGLSPLTMYTYTVTARDAAGNQTTASAAASATTPDTPTSNILLETGVVSGVGNSWTTVNLGSSYSSMVVVATPNYDNTSAPGSVRIQNATGNSFQVRLDAAGATAPNAADVYFMVVEEGVYTQANDGVTMEAVKFNSTVTDNASATWNGTARTYSNSYTNPVVLGQVMTYNDSGHVEFWSMSTTRANKPTSSALAVGKTVNEDPDNAHANETIGYIVIEAGSGTMDGVNYSAGVGADGVAGVTNAPPYARPVSGLSGNASVGIATLTAMDGNNGGWAVFYGANPISNTNINLVIDEDQLGDTERSHTGEEVAFIVFEDQGGGGDTTPPTPNPATFASAPASAGISSIAMTATAGSDPSGPVEYFFGETTANPGGSDSGWQTSTSYTDTLLSPSTQYCYTVTSRDSAGNTGNTSAQSCATTDGLPDTNPPSSPSVSSAVADSDSQITVTSTVSTDAEGSNPVEYQFNETTGGAGATDSGWQTGTTHVDAGLSASTQYCYQVRSRDSVGNTNAYSATSCATTQGGGGGCTAVISDDFEAGNFGNWNDGGTDCILHNGANSPQGSYSIDLQDNTSTSVTTTNALNLSSYQDVKVDFSYNPISFEGTEDFFLEISTNGGSSYSTLKQYVNDVDFVDTAGPQTDSVTSSGISLTSNTVIRFRCDASGNGDDVYLDAITISGCGTGTPDTDPPTPNPATFSSAPSADSDTAISMTATTANDASGPVEYNFNHVSGTPGGTDSGWQTSTSYTDSGLSASTQYCYTVQSRDSLGNTGSASAQSCATTQAGGGGCGTTWAAQVNNTSGISYTGFVNVEAPGAFQNDAHYIDGSGGTANFSINGNGLRIYVWRLPDVGQSFTISIDGGAAQTVSVGTGPEDSFMAYENTSLSCATHSIVINSVSGETHIDAYQVRN